MHQSFSEADVFDDIDLDFLVGDRPTWPPPGSADLVIEDKYEPLFISATWSLVASVGERVIARSNPIDHAHTGPFIKRWSKQLIRTKYQTLRELGVDADSEYVKLGGDPEELRT